MRQSRDEVAEVNLICKRINKGTPGGYFSTQQKLTKRIGDLESALLAIDDACGQGGNMRIATIENIIINSYVSKEEGEV